MPFSLRSFFGGMNAVSGRAADSGKSKFGLNVIKIGPQTSDGEIDGWVNKIIDYLVGTIYVHKYEISKAVFEEVVKDTPVLTGFARASWTVGINTPKHSDAVEVAKGIVIPPPSFNAPELTRYNDNYVITNDCPYIDVLDQGHSKQAPIGFIARAVGRGIGIGMQRAKSKI